MRISLLGLFLGIFLVHVHADVRAQRVTLSKQSMTLIDFFKEIRKQTSYDFVYDQAITAGKTISIQANQRTVEEVLNTALKGQGLTWDIKDKIIVVREAPKAIEDKIFEEIQQRVSGKVVNEKGEPLAGATLVLHGKDFLTVENGTFDFPANVGDRITINFIGYQPRTITVENFNPMTIRMSPHLEEMEDVVVTALGLKKAEAGLGYAVEEVKGEVFEKVKSDKVIDLLAGRVAGLRVNSRSGVLQDAAITLRGREPLYVVNGNPVGVGFRGIAADDIESISVLKGPQASVLYGSRGIDGAIVITTKNSGTSEQVEDIGKHLNITALLILILANWFPYPGYHTKITLEILYKTV